MKKLISRILIGSLLVIGLGLLYLTNTGILSAGQPIISQVSVYLQDSGRTVAFTNVNVIPMDREQLLPAQTVIIRDGIIVTVGETFQAEVPENVMVIDGQGKYLMPGLVDMHVHEVYRAILDAARENDMPVVGHVPFSVGLDEVLAGGQQTIEYLTGYIDPDAVEFIIPEDQIDDYALITRQAGVWNCVTLSEYPKSKETPEGFERLQNQLGLVYVSPGTRMISPFLYMMAAKSHTYQGSDYPQRITALNQQMVRALHQVGAGILLGTDAAQAYHLPGFAVHEELAMLVEAGLSPYEALAAGTRNPALAMGKQGKFGTLEVGKRADLILLENNPLSDVRNLQKRSGVMLRGRWLPEAQLQSMLASLVNSYKPSLAERIWPFSFVAIAIFLITRKVF